MRYFVMTVLFFIGLVLQATLFSHLTVAGVKPDLVLVLLVFYALLHGPMEGALMGLAGGLLQDLMFGQNIGMNTLAKLVTGYLFGALEKKIYKENVLVPMVVLFLATFLNETVLYILRFFSHVPGPTGESSINYLASVKNIFFSTAVYNSCLAPFIYGRFYKSSQKGLLRITDR
ncbi:MAG: rod shape-determining protein MreD [Eubacteriales bacterium]